MEINKILVITSLCNILSFSCGFTPNRTEWSAVPQLTPREKTSLEVLMKDFEVRTTAKARKTSLPEEESSWNENVTKADNFFRERRNSNSMTENHTENFIIDLINTSRANEKTFESFIKRNNKNEPLNVIWFIVDEKNKRLTEVLWDETLFPTRKLLWSCSEHLYFPWSESQVNCNCEYFLKTNIMSLLSWAEYYKEMTTSIVYENPTVYTKTIEMSPRILTKPEISFASIDDIKELNESNDDQKDEQWRISDTLKRFGRSFLESLMGAKLRGRQEQSNIEHQQQQQQQLAALRRASFHALLEDASFLGRERGYILVAYTNPDDIPELLFNKLPANALTIVTSSCARDGGSIWLYARGSSSNRLMDYSLINLPDLPSTIWSILDQPVPSSNSCGSSSECSSMVKLEPLLEFNEPLELASAARLARAQQQQPRVQIVKTKEEIEIKINNTTTESNIEPNNATTSVELNVTTQEPKKINESTNSTEVLNFHLNAMTKNNMDERDQKVHKDIWNKTLKESFDRQRKTFQDTRAGMKESYAANSQIRHVADILTTIAMLAIIYIFKF